MKRVKTLFIKVGIAVAISSTYLK